MQVPARLVVGVAKLRASVVAKAAPVVKARVAPLPAAPALVRIVVVVVDHRLLGRTPSEAPAPEAAAPEAAAMPETVQQRFNPLEGQRSGRDSSSGRRRRTQKARSPARRRADRRSGRVVRRITRRRRIILRSHGRALRQRRRRRRIVPPEQTPQKTGGMGRLRLGLLDLPLGLLQLLLQLPHLRLAALEGEVLHQHRLRQNIQRVRIRPQALL